MSTTPQYLTPTEAAAQLGVSQQCVSQWLDQERIPFALIAGRRLIEPRHCKRPKPRKPGPKVS